MATYTITQKKSLLTDLIQMASIDYPLKKEESEFIYAVGKSMNIEPDEVGFLINNYQEIDKVVPKTTYKRILQFHRIMIIMFIDNHIHEKEVELLYRIALKYGYRVDIVHELLEAMEDHPYGEIPERQLMEIHSRARN
ncbi:MAG: hypothetical protein WBA16_11535 [Nonlabens sp.]